MNKKIKTIGLCLSTLYLFSTFSHADVIATDTVSTTSSSTSTENPVDDTNFTAKVLNVVDGSTIEVIKSNIGAQSRLVHISSINVPSIETKYGKTSKTTLENLVLGKDVNLSVSGSAILDQNGKSIEHFYANITINGKDIATELVKKGSAIVLDNSPLTTDALKQAEVLAQKSKIGLWKSASTDKTLKNWINIIDAADKGSIESTNEDVYGDVSGATKPLLITNLPRCSKVVMELKCTKIFGKKVCTNLPVLKTAPNVLTLGIKYPDNDRVKQVLGNTAVGPVIACTATALGVTTLTPAGFLAGKAAFDGSFLGCMSLALPIAGKTAIASLLGEFGFYADQSCRW
jgi:endonuclease YncB( thermonuclease family)